MDDLDRNAISQHNVDDFLRANGVPKLRWYQRDISRTLTKAIGLAIFALFAVGVHYIGILKSAIFTTAYVGGVAFLVALYLTYTWQWPRLIRYFRQLWRRSY
jgi:hypothetical protein